MDILLFSFNAVSPMFIAIILGAFLARRSLAGEREIAFLNTLCFRYLLSTHIFNSVLSVDFYAEFNPHLVITFIVIITGLFIAAWAVFSVLIKDMAKRCIYITSAYRSNNIIYALPLAANLFGHEGIKVSATLVPFTIIFFNFFTVIVFVFHKQRMGAADTAGEKPLSWKAAFKTCAHEIITNPLIIGSSAGIVCSLLRIPLPSFIRSGINSIAQAATPVSLILLGMQINLRGLFASFRTVLVAALVRVVLVPAALIPIAAALGFRGTELGALAVAFAAPSAVSNLIMARYYGVAPQLAAQTVYLSTLLSLVTIFFLVSILRALGLF
jgi:predicted permease